MINKLKCLFLLVVCAGLMSGAVNVSAQTSQHQASIGKVIEFYEWAFETKFTNEEREQMQSIKEDGFRKDAASEKKAEDQTIANYSAIKAKNENEQARVRGIFVPDFVGQLRGMNGDDEAKLLLSVYDRAQSAAEADAEAAGVGDISVITGKWAWAHTGSGIVNGSTGAWVGGNGSRFTYEFSPNGNVKFTGIMNVMQGACSQQIFRSIEGKASLSGNNLTIRWAPEKFTRDFSCDRAGNYTKTMPAKTERLKINFKTDLGQKQLCFVGAECFSSTK